MPLAAANFSARPHVELIRARDQLSMDSTPKNSEVAHLKTYIYEMSLETSSDDSGGGDVCLIAEGENYSSDKLVFNDILHCNESLGLEALQLLLTCLVKNCKRKTNYRFAEKPSESLLQRLEYLLASVNGVLADETSPRSKRSPKLDSLLKLLQYHTRECAKNEVAFCGIVFVERRYCAGILQQLLANLATNDKLKGVKPVFITGQAGSTVHPSDSHSGHSNSLSQFRSGAANLLIATSVVEEGIDVPHCNFVCKFDLPHSV